MKTYYRSRPAMGHGMNGQALTELALIVPVLVVMLLGIVEAAGAFNALSDVQAAAAHGARVGALLGNGGATVFTCPDTGSVITDTVDMAIVKAVINTPGIDSNNIAKIQIFKANNSGGVVISGTTPLINDYRPPFIAGTSLVTNTYNWPSCIRKSGEPADSVGVHVSYRYHPITPLFGQAVLSIDHQSIQRLNPTKNDSNPCPVPAAPTDVSAHWTGSEPSTTDAISWTAGSDATGYKVYANINGAGARTTPVATVPGSSGTISVSYTHNVPGAQVSYQVVGTNYCGDGDISDPVPNGQYAPPSAPVIITATASITSPGYDTIVWQPVPDAASYTITQTSSLGGSPSATTVGATSALIQDPYSAPVTVTYQVAATSLSALSGPASSAVVTPSASMPITVDDSISATTPTTNTFTYSGSSWLHCNTTTGPSCSPTVVATGLYSNTASASNHSGDSVAFTVAVSHIPTVLTVYGSKQNNGTSGASVQITGPGGPTSGTANFYCGSSTCPASVGPVYTTTLSAPGTYTLTITVPSGSKYVTIDDIVLQ